MSEEFHDIPISEIKHFGIKGMKWGVRNPLRTDGRIVGSKYATKDSTNKKSSNKDTPKPRKSKVKTETKGSNRVLKEKESKVVKRAREAAYSLAAKVNPREINYSIKRAMTKDNTSDKVVMDLVNNATKEKGVLPTDEKVLAAVTRQGIQMHKDAKYDNLDDKDLNNLKKYTDAAVYSRTINSYLATGQPPHIADKAKELKDTIGKNSLSDMTVYRSTALKFSTDGLANKLDSMGEDNLKAAFNQFEKNFKGKSFKENRVYSTSTSPEFAIDTWRKVNPNAAKTYNSYLIINTKGTPGLLADGRTGSGKKIVNTGSNQEAILAPKKMTYRKLTFDEERQMFAVYLDAE